MLARIESQLHDLYLEYFHKAEAHRRWNVLNDVPWHMITRKPNPEIAEVIQAFMAVEMFLPDYTSKIMQLVRSSRGRAWFQANWGYEESKHSLVLEMWMTKSGARSVAQVHEFQEEILSREWNLPYQTPLEMILYTMLQEFATSVNYRGLRRVAEDSRDSALDKALTLLARDETGHFEFFKNGTKLFMARDRDHVLETLNKVIHTFKMPAQTLIPGFDKHGRLLRELGIFDDRIYARDVVRPVLKALGVEPEELRDARHRFRAAA